MTLFLNIIGSLKYGTKSWLKQETIKHTPFPHRLFDTVLRTFLWVCLLIVILIVWDELDPSAARSVEAKPLVEELRAQTFVKTSEES